MKNRWVWIGLAAVLILSAAFLFLNFHAAMSNTRSEKNIIKSSIGDELPQPMQRRDKISIAVVGEGALAGMLKTALMKELRQAGLGDIELVSDLEPTYPNPVLVVKSREPELFWTPFYATSRLSIQAGYASAGDTSFMGDRPATIDNRNGPALSMHGDYKVTDSSWGLISRPGYHQILADYMAREIIAALKDVYQVS